MNYLKKISISLACILGFIFIATFILTFFNYINIINFKIMTILKLILPIMALFLGGFVIGRRSNQKGWLEGLKLGLIFVVILVLFNYLGLNNKFELKNLLYYLILITTTIFGSIIGINIKKNKNS